MASYFSLAIPYHPGDEIQIEEVRGTVKRVNIRNTIVQTNEDSTIFTPNSDLAFRKITNWTYKDPKGRAEIIVGVAYGSPTSRCSYRKKGFCL